MYVMIIIIVHTGTVCYQHHIVQIDWDWLKSIIVNFLVVLAFTCLIIFLKDTGLKIACDGMLQGQTVVLQVYV